MPRTLWEQLPGAVHEAVKARFGTWYATREVEVGGSDSDLTTWLYFLDGRHLFAKGARLDDEAKTYYLDVEARVNPWTPACAPRLRHRFRVAGWDLLLFDDVGSRMWAEFERDHPEHPGDLPLVVEALDSLRSCVAPRVELPTLWGHIADWCEPSARPLLAGLTLVHGDPAPSNFVMSDRRAHLVDWAGASLGPAWADAVLWGFRLVADGGQSPEEAAQWVAKVRAFAEAPRAGIRALAEAEARRMAHWARATTNLERGVAGSRTWAEYWA